MVHAEKWRTLTMNTQTYDPEAPIDDLRPSRFLKVADLRDRWHVCSMPVTIARVEKEPTIPNPKDLDPATADAKNPQGKPRIVYQPVLYLKMKDGQTWPQGYLVSADVDVQSLKTATKAQKISELPGKTIMIIIGEWRKDEVLRISPLPPMPGEKPKPYQSKK